MEVAPCMIDLKRNTKTQMTFKFVYNLWDSSIRFYERFSSAILSDTCDILGLE